MPLAAQSLEHEHIFLGSDHDRNERRVWLVIALTAAMMVAEIVAGSLFGSMALLADGWHMSTHAGAMLIAALAYLVARRQAHNRRYTFGTGKLGDLAGFASAIVLGLIALLIAWESVMRLAQPVAIDFNQAILVAVLGLLVNLASAWLLRNDHSHHGHDHGHDHGHRGHDHTGHDGGRDPGGHRHHPQAGHDHVAHDHVALDYAAHDHTGYAAPGHGDERHHNSGEAHAHAHVRAHAHTHPHAQAGGEDNNLRAAYLHVLADALTSVLAIVALILGSLYGWTWLDPVMGVVGGLVIARWSVGLVRTTGGVLLDAQPQADALAGRIRKRLETKHDRITDLHVWQVGPGHHAVIVAIATPAPHVPAFYKQKLKDMAGLSHLTVEVTPDR